MLLKTRPIYETKELELLQKNIPDIENCVGDRKNIKGNWQARNAFVCPGLSDDGILALTFEGTSDYHGELQEYGKSIKKFFSDAFGTDNVIYIGLWKGNENEANCLAVIFPLRKRMLQGSFWLYRSDTVDNPTAQAQPSEELQDEYRKTIEGLEKESNITEDEIKEKQKSLEQEEYDLFEVPKAAETGRLNVKDMLHQEELPNPEITVKQDKASFETDDRDNLDQIFHTILNYFTSSVEKNTLSQARKGLIKQSSFLESVRNHAKANFKDLSEPGLNYILDKIYSAIYKNFVLDSLVEEDSVEEICVYRFDRIGIIKNGKKEMTNIRFATAAEYQEFVRGLAERNNTNYNNVYSASFTCTDEKYRLKYTLFTDFAGYCGYPYLHIRKDKREKKRLAEYGLTEEKKELLKKSIQKGESILFSGPSLKKVLGFMNSLMEEIPQEYETVILQDCEDLFSNSRNLISLQLLHDNTGKMKMAEQIRSIAVNTDIVMTNQINQQDIGFIMEELSVGRTLWLPVLSENKKDAEEILKDMLTYEKKYSENRIARFLTRFRMIIFVDAEGNAHI